MSECRFVDRYVGAFVDGELDPASMVAVDRHVDVCGPCQERLAFERRARFMVRDAAAVGPAPAALRARVSAALAAEPAPARTVALRWPVLGTVAGTSLLALFAVVVAVTGRTGATTAFLGGGVYRPVLEDVVRLHSSALPVDVPAEQTQSAQMQSVQTAAVRDYFRGKVAFPVQPAVLERPDARFLGARYVSVHARNAVALFYDVGGARVTVVVYEAPGLEPEEIPRVRMGSRDVYLDTVHGHAVPVRRAGDLHYAFTGDLDRRQMLELAATARVAP